MRKSCILILSIFVILFLVACRENKMYLVSFSMTMEHPHLNAIEPQTIKHGKQAIDPQFVSPSQTWIFEGWYFENQLFDFNQIIESNITLHAKWTILESTPLFIDISNPLTAFENFTDIKIIRVLNQIKTSTSDGLEVDKVATHYQIEIVENLIGNMNQDYIVVRGGSYSSYLTYYYIDYPKELEVNKYYLIFTRSSDSDFYSDFDIYENNYTLFYPGFNIQDLFSYNSDLSVHEQSELVKSILQPYIDAINNS